MSLNVLHNEITNQLKGVPEASNLCEAAWDLYDAVKDDDEAAIVLEDFKAGQGIKDAEKAVHSWCDKNHSSAKVAGCPRYIARRVIREAFGLPTEENAGAPAAKAASPAPTPAAKPKEAAKAINLLDFL